MGINKIRYKEEASGVLKQISDDRLLNDAYKEIDDSNLTLWAYDKKKEVYYYYINVTVALLTITVCCVSSWLRMVVMVVLLLHDVTTLHSSMMS